MEILGMALGAFVLFSLVRMVQFRKAKARGASWMGDGALVVDVRSPGEFARGSRQGSLNIPLDELQGRLAELDKTRPVVLCCASGARSSVAAGILRKNGFAQVMNVGPWQNAPQ